MRPSTLSIILYLFARAAAEERPNVFTIGSDGDVSDGSDDDEMFGHWAANMDELVLGEDEVEDERLPTIDVGDDQATLPDASPKALAVLRRKQLANMGLVVEVLESQLVVVSGVESKAQSAKRRAAGLGPENALASALACRPINGTALFLLAHRLPLPGAPNRHELSFFTSDLWSDFVEYMTRARGAAPFFDGNDASASPWNLRMHWNVMASERRVPFVLRRPELRVVATPRLVAVPGQ